MSSSLLSYDIDVELAREFSIRGAVSSPIKVFHLAEFGIQPGPFLSRIGPTFHDLPWDPYDAALAAERIVRDCFPQTYAAHETEWLELWSHLDDHLANPLSGPQFWTQLIHDDEILQCLAAIRPYRRRSCFQFWLNQDRSTAYRWRLRELGTRTFAQSVNDIRARPRRFAPPPDTVYRDTEIQYLMCLVSQLVCQTASVLADSLRLTLHQMITYADSRIARSPAPEGVHQDGCSFIVSALVIERHNVIGGTSNIYYVKDGGLALSCELQAGQGIFQSDTHNEYWHGVTPVFPKNSTALGYRSILGLDLNLE